MAIARKKMLLKSWSKAYPDVNAGMGREIAALMSGTEESENLNGKRN